MDKEPTIKSSSVSSGLPVPKEEKPGFFDEEYQKNLFKKHLEEVLEGYYKRYEKDIKIVLEKNKTTDPNIIYNMVMALKNDYYRLKGVAEEIARHRVRIEIDNCIDPISGLYDKKIISEMYEFALGTLKEEERIVVIAFDLDKFRNINEIIGHGDADKVLKNIGDAIKASVRPDDFGTRIGGDEFVIILNRVKADTNIIQLVQRICKNISQVTWAKKDEQKKEKISISAGYTTITKKNASFFEYVRKKADSLAGISKFLGRNRLTTLDENEEYICYKLLEGDYKEDKTGSVKDLEKHTLESCLREISSAEQRIEEEILLLFNNSEKELNDFIEKQFPQINPKNFSGLNNIQKAELLLFVRNKDK